MFRDVPGCSGMFRDVPEYSGMFHVPGFISGRPIFDMFGTTIETDRTSVSMERALRELCCSYCRCFAVNVCFRRKKTSAARVAMAPVGKRLGVTGLFS